MTHPLGKKKTEYSRVISCGYSSPQIYTSGSSSRHGHLLGLHSESSSIISLGAPFPCFSPQAAASHSLSCHSRDLHLAVEIPLGDIRLWVWPHSITPSLWLPLSDIRLWGPPHSLSPKLSLLIDIKP